MKWCEIVGTEPYLCLNFGTGTLDEGLCALSSRTETTSLMYFSTALGWLEYCNSTQDTHYANLRRKNGRDKPYKVLLSLPSLSKL